MFMGQIFLLTAQASMERKTKLSDIPAHKLKARRFQRGEGTGGGGIFRADFPDGDWENPHENTKRPNSESQPTNKELQNI